MSPDSALALANSGIRCSSGALATAHSHQYCAVLSQYRIVRKRPVNDRRVIPENQKDVLCDDPAAVPEYPFGRKGNAMTDKRAGPSVRIQRNAQVRRRQILAAASSLIQEKGYGATSLDAVVERAGCSKSAIYEFFGGKEGLISALSDDIVEELSLALSPPEPPRRVS